MVAVRKQLAPQRGLQKIEQAARTGEEIVEAHIVGECGEPDALSVGFPLADTLLVLQLRRGKQRTSRGSANDADTANNVRLRLQIIKREPGTLGSRTWSLYGRLYLRHFNELDHELNARLNRAYRPASRYMSIFTSPVMTVLAKNVAFVAGSVLAVLLILTIYDEDVLTVEHVLTLMTILGAILAGARAFIPDENLVWCPEQLLTAVLAHTHYRPDSWRGHAHTQSTRAQVAQLFQYRAVHLLEELLSPLLTPFILCFRMRPRALDIVDFYRNFTIEVTGVGDVCSFAQMDVRKHGNPMWQTAAQTPGVEERDAGFGGKHPAAGRDDKIHVPMSNQYTQAEDGKTELSLIHFTLTNPEWRPPSHAETFVTALRERAKRDAGELPTDVNPLYSSLNSLSSLGVGVSLDRRALARRVEFLPGELSRI